MKNLKNAKETAQANADYFGVPYVVFEDTNGNVRVERYFDTATYNKTVFYPKNVSTKKFGQVKGK